MELSNGDFIADLNRWYKAYIDNIKALSYSINTLELYSRAIDTFIEYSRQYQDEVQLNELKSMYFTSYLAYLEDDARKKGKKLTNGSYLSKSTKQTYLKAIRAFFSFISDNNDELHTFERFFKNIKVADSSKQEEKIIYLNDEEIGKILNVIEREKGHRKDVYGTYRNAFLIKLMLYAGLRISEALKVRLKDFSQSEEEGMLQIFIQAKGGKSQIGFINAKTIEDELDYFENIEKLHRDEMVMRTNTGKPLDRTNAFIIVNRTYKRAGVMYKEGLHLLRHSLAMRLTLRNVNPVVVQKVLRHSKITTTTIYAKATAGAVAGALVDKEEPLRCFIAHDDK